jgi:hypothetical protein
MSAPKSKIPPLSDLLDARTASAYAGTATRTLARWAEQGLINRWYIGGGLRYSRSELDSLATTDRPDAAVASSERLKAANRRGDSA